MGGSPGHVIVGFTSAVLVMLIGTTLADGRSLFTRKDTRTEVAIGALKPGIGVVRDFKGHGYDNQFHPFAGCEDQKRLGKATEGTAFGALAFLSFSVIVNLLGAQSGKGVFGLASVACQALSGVLLLISFSCAAALYNEYYCDKEQLRHFYQLSYGIPFLAMACFLSFVNAGAIVATGSLSDADAPATEKVVDEE